MNKFFLSLTLIGLTSLAYPQKFDLAGFYGVMRDGKMEAVNKQISLLGGAPGGSHDAYEGALLMKKAGLADGPGRKLTLFKQGHRKLEAAIKQAPENPEFRFLRVMIQEHAPGILGYKENLKTDSDFVVKSYGSLPITVRHAVADYSKKSKVLKLPVS